VGRKVIKFNKKKYATMVLAGIVISIAIDSVIPVSNPDHNSLYDFLISIFLTITIWEGNLLIDKLLNKKLPWLQRPVKRLVIQLPISMVYSGLTIYIVMFLYQEYLCEVPREFKEVLFRSSIVIGTLFSVVLLGIEISMQFFLQWKRSLTEIEKYKSESLQSQLQNLKNQINPHFLFNNLSVLSSLVYSNQDKAVDFINQLAKVYRYLLDTRNNELVSLDTELTFIKSYIYLLVIRFQTNIVFEINIDDASLSKLIPPMALQTLLENAIKHNEISATMPLRIQVVTKNEQLIITNNLQLRTSHEPSSKTGLQNIIDRYKHFTNAEVEIIQDSHSFIVKIPLIGH